MITPREVEVILLERNSKTCSACSSAAVCKTSIEHNYCAITAPYEWIQQAAKDIVLHLSKKGG